MRLYQILFNNEKIFSIMGENNRLVPLSELGFKCNNLNEFLSMGENLQAKVNDKLKNNNSQSNKNYKLDDVRLLSPVCYPGQDIICIADNYNESDCSDNAMNSNSNKDITIFSKRVTVATGDGESVNSYKNIIKKLDYEAELLVILGKDVHCADIFDAEKSVFGYSIINDFSARDMQASYKQWYCGKSPDGFAAIGPCIVTKDELKESDNLEISCLVNGEVRQKSNTKHMKKSPAVVISELSQFMTLKTGTMIAMGTPAGTGKDMNPQVFLKPGDKVECIIEKIGTLKNTII